MNYNDSVEKRILITAKTYPTPSKKYVETVCTAGITEEGNWIRLYPIRFRHLSQDQQFGIFNWIRAQVRTAGPKDKRPESHRIETDTLYLEKKLDPRKDIEEKLRYLLPLVKYTTSEIDAEYRKDMVSLALLKPKVMDDFIIEPQSQNWTEAELASLNQMDLLEKDQSDYRELKKVPYRFSAQFRCHDSNCPGHTKVITAWEYTWAYFDYRRRYGSEELALQKLKESWMNKFSPDRNGYLILGTTYPHPSFITIGYFSYPLSYVSQQCKKDYEQISLFS